jgi:hypothetical protein
MTDLALGAGADAAAALAAAHAPGPVAIARPAAPSMPRRNASRLLMPREAADSSIFNACIKTPNC